MVKESSPPRCKRRGIAPRRAWAGHKRVYPLSARLVHSETPHAVSTSFHPGYPTFAVCAGRIAKSAKSESHLLQRTTEQRQWPPTAPFDALYRTIHSDDETLRRSLSIPCASSPAPLVQRPTSLDNPPPTESRLHRQGLAQLLGAALTQ